MRHGDERGTATDLDLEEAPRARWNVMEDDEAAVQRGARARSRAMLRAELDAPARDHQARAAQAELSDGTDAEVVDPLQVEGDVLEVGAADAPAEAEADRIADGVVHRLHDGSEDPLPPSGRDDQPPIRRGVAAPMTEPGAASSTSFDEHRPRFEAAMGADLSAVDVSVGGDADAKAGEIGAAAYAHGDTVGFRADTFRPGTRDGDRLIAHELAHVLQARGAASQPVRRKLVVGGERWRYDDIDPFVARLRSEHDEEEQKARGRRPRQGKGKRDVAAERREAYYPTDVAAEILHSMTASSRTFAYATEDELMREVVMRQRTVANLDQPASCQYPDGDHGPRLNPDYWKKGEPKYHWTVKDGVKPSAAVRSIFEGDDEEWRLECYTMTVAAVYKAQLDTLGDDQFDRHYPDGLTLSADEKLGGLPALKDAGVIEVVRVKGEEDLLPGDWVYFKNHPDYVFKHPRGSWQGENTVCVGRNAAGEMMYRGFGIEDSTAQELRKELAERFNSSPEEEGVPAEYRRMQTRPEDIPGPQLRSVRRPAKAALEDR